MSALTRWRLVQLSEDIKIVDGFIYNLASATGPVEAAWMRIRAALDDTASEEPASPEPAPKEDADAGRSWTIYRNHPATTTWSVWHSADGNPFPPHDWQKEGRDYFTVCPASERDQALELLAEAEERAPKWLLDMFNEREARVEALESQLAEVRG